MGIPIDKAKEGARVAMLLPAYVLGNSNFKQMARIGTIISTRKIRNDMAQDLDKAEAPFASVENLAEPCTSLLASIRWTAGDGIEDSNPSTTLWGVDSEYLSLLETEEDEAMFILAYF